VFGSTRTVVLCLALISGVCLIALSADPSRGWVANYIALVAYCIAFGWTFCWGRSQLEHLAQVDPLCRVLNRWGMDERLTFEIARSRRCDRPLTIAVLDLDYFKSVNGRLEHAAGDELFRRLARAWSAGLRPEDMLARVGGDEFVVALAGYDEREARHTVERLVDIGGQSASIGLAELGPDDELPDLLRRVDFAMLNVKRTRHASRDLDAPRDRPAPT